MLPARPRRRSIDRALAAAERGRDDVIARATVCACAPCLQLACVVHSLEAVRCAVPGLECPAA